MKKWQELPNIMRNNSVRPYYDYLYQKRKQLFLKRVLDRGLAGIMIILLSPVFLFLAVWIKVDSPGPVFFRQIRVTQYGETFRIFKFRTMVNDAENKGNQVTVENDSRITKVGQTIRKYRLDEIPQLINILTGDMSFVGTRPEVTKYVEKYTNEMQATLLLPAGVTSLASVLYKDESKLLENSMDADDIYIEEILPAKMKYNLQSVMEFSLVNELRILFMTIFAVLGKEYKNE